MNREAIAAELQDLEGEEKNNFGRMKQLELELDGAPSPDQIAEKEITRVAVEVEEIVKTVRRQESEVTELKISLASSREREEGMDRQRRRLEEETENLEEVLDARRRRLTDGEERKKDLIRQSEESRKIIEDSRTKIAAVDAEIKVLEDRIAELNVRCRAKEDTYRNVRPRFQEVQGRLSSQEVRLAEWRLKEQEITRRMREKYQVELDELDRAGEEIDPESLEAKIGKLKKKMEKMTNVNLAALEDRETYEERLNLLTEQKADLEAASRDIEEAISRINVTARQKLQETYDTVRDNFRRIFSDLFDGGKADLILEEGKDILESGLEIVAQPPGKKLSSINLLSGGEKALTTIALVFSLFKVQPSPFYVLDEIDAPLDEANISRFVKLLKSLVSESQFIIITHNKRSISEADILYGITMEETGISKVVSVRLAGDELEKEIEELV